MRVLTSFLYTFLFVFSFSIVNVFAGDFAITINNDRHALVANAGGCEYQWFKDGKLLGGATERFLPISEGGTYEVQIVGEQGEVSAPSVTVAVNAMGAIIKIYTIGDSTVQDYAAGYYPRKGWGQVLGAFFNTANVQIVNKAVGGTSSMSFYNSFWPAVRDALIPGDFVFIQFGINDRNSADPARYAPTGGVFEGYLTKFVNETKAKGAFPVLVTTVRRNAWNADGTVYDSYHDHPIAVRTVAKQLGVPLIDLDAKLKVDMEAAGELYCTRFWSNTYPAGEYPNYPNGLTDQVHFQEMGAIHNASLVMQGIKELSTDANVSKLIPFVKPQYKMTVSANPTGSDDATTRSADYPQGLTVTLKTLPKTGKTFQKWNNASATQISMATLTTVTSGTSATSFMAMYQGATMVTDCNNTPNGTAKLDNCDRCTGGTTGKAACTSVAEVESEACKTQGVTETSNTGFKGAAYFNSDNATDVSMSFSIQANAAGNSTLSFRYATSNDRPAQIVLNGTTLSSQLPFISTGTFTVWNTVDISLSLLKGQNTLVLSPITASGLPNLDQIGYVGPGLSKGSCVVTDLQEETAAPSLRVFPNPSTSAFTIEGAGSFQYTLSDISGKRIEAGSGEFHSEMGHGLSTGIYTLKLQTGTSTLFYKLMKE